MTRAPTQVWTGFVGTESGEVDVSFVPGEAPDPAHAPGSVFAPSETAWKPWVALARAVALKDHQNLRREAFRLFEAAYLAEMRVSNQRHKAAWKELLRRPRVVIVCGCPWPDLCHRATLATILTRLGAVDCGEILRAEPEPPPPPPPRRPRAPRGERPRPRRTESATSVEALFAAAGALGLKAIPTPEELRTAWRAAALRTHPDRGGSAAAFKTAREAYERLLRLVGEP